MVTVPKYQKRDQILYSKVRCVVLCVVCGGARVEYLVFIVNFVCGFGKIKIDI
jgi:hypothetical protein